MYALKKFPTECGADESKTFRDLKINLMLNLSRCKRKLGDVPGAIDLATKVLDVRPQSYEAFYARARAKRDDRLVYLLCKNTLYNSSQSAIL
jgi:hypothetical protein